MIYKKEDHTFMICAYQENPYLEECIVSVMKQTVLGNVKISTSTPNQYITNMANKYSLPIVCNCGKGDAVDNLNFAYGQAETPLVTLCHQDDYYEPSYLEKVLRVANRGGNPVIVYTDYYEDREGKKVGFRKLLLVKRILNFPFRFFPMQENKWVRRKVLSLGDPICCPSVTFCKKSIYNVPFTNTYSNIYDWDAWLRLAKKDGRFIYLPEKLVVHRIWKGSTTTEMITNGLRDSEEREIFSSLWPRPLDEIIFQLYRLSQKSNRQR